MRGTLATLSMKCCFAAWATMGSLLRSRASWTWPLLLSQRTTCQGIFRLLYSRQVCQTLSTILWSFCYDRHLSHICVSLGVFLVQRLHVLSWFFAMLLRILISSIVINCLFLICFCSSCTINDLYQLLVSLALHIDPSRLAVVCFSVSHFVILGIHSSSYIVCIWWVLNCESFSLHHRQLCYKHRHMPLPWTFSFLALSYVMYASFFGLGV